jgi:hypothetical protein
MEHNGYYRDRVTKERVRVTYNVSVTMPAVYYGSIDIEALSEQEAAEIALKRAWADGYWQDYHYYGDESDMTVDEVVCLDARDNFEYVEEADDATSRCTGRAGVVGSAAAAWKQGRRN